MDIADYLFKALPIKSSLGLTINLGEGESQSISLIALQEVKGIIEISASEIPCTTDTISHKINLHVPAYLTITGKGILHKKVKNQGNLGLTGLVKQTLPQVKPEEVVIQYTPLSSREGILSVMRRNELKLIIDQLTDLGIHPFKLTIGPSALLNYIRLAEIKDSFKAGNHEVVFENHQLVNIQYSTDWIENTISIGDENLCSSQLLPYCTALCHFVNSEDIPSVEIPEITSIRKEFVHQRTFQKAIKIIPVALLGLLLLNFGLFSYLYGRANSLQMIFSREKLAIEKYQLLSEKVQEKSALFNEESSYGEGQRLPYFADQIALSLVDGIKLSEVKIYPMNEELMNNKQTFEFLTNCIEVKGSSISPSQINHWIQKITTLNWVENIGDPKYTWDAPNSQGVFHFIIKIKDVE